MRLFRERLLAPLVERPAISEALVLELFAWRHPGFSARVGEAIPFELKKAIEDVACYLVRNPLSLKKLVYLDGQQAVLYRSRNESDPGPKLRGHGEPLAWAMPASTAKRARSGRASAAGARPQRPRRRILSSSRPLRQSASSAAHESPASSRFRIAKRTVNASIHIASPGGWRSW